MGAWGTAIFSDDLACDVRSGFRDLVGDGMTAEAATRSLELEHADSLEDEDDAPVFWIALALAQHRLGRLLPRVLERALLEIEGGRDLRRWEHDPTARGKRAAVLQKARSEMLSPQPQARRIPRRFRDENGWAVGQAVAYRTASGAYCAFHILGHHEGLGGRSPVVRVFGWTGEALPTEEELLGAGYREPLTPEYTSQTMVAATSGSEYPKGRVEPLPFEIATTEVADGYAAALWRGLDEHLEKGFGIR